MAVEFPCPHCGQILSAPDGAAGTAGACRFCGAEIEAPPPGVSQPGEPTGAIDPLAILAESWRVLVANWNLIVGVVWLSNILAFVCLLPVFVLLHSRGMTGAPTGPLGTSAQAMPLWADIVISLVTLPVNPLMAAPLYVVDRLLSRGEAITGDMFRFFRQYGALLLYFALLTLPGTVVSWLIHPLVRAGSAAAGPASHLQLSIVQILVTAFMCSTLGPGVMEIVDRGASGMEAAKASWAFTLGHRWAIFASLVLLGLAYLAGALACWVGLLFTAGLPPIGFVLLYRNIRGLHGTVD